MILQGVGCSEVIYNFCTFEHLHSSIRILQIRHLSKEIYTDKLNFNEEFRSLRREDLKNLKASNSIVQLLPLWAAPCGAAKPAFLSEAIVIKGQNVKLGS